MLNVKIYINSLQFSTGMIVLYLLFLVVKQKLYPRVPIFRTLKA